ncbi:MAG TPA: hypothetical protein VNW90_10710 [Acetobacteraceae bacterium]|jgi:hypothetical protein|nr:hypothetical protein [Acetobacteraceae bacterium]
MKYKIIAENGAYMARDPTIVRLELGADQAAARAYGVRAQINELLPFETEIEGDHIVFGPHLEPLDDPAKEKAAAYWKLRPNASLDPTRSLPLGRDPMVAATFETATLAMLERMAAEAAGKPVAPSAAPNDGRMDALTDAMTKLAQLVASLAPPAQANRRAA